MRRAEFSSCGSSAGWLSGGGAWTHVFKYNAFSLLEDAIDARGTTTHLTYDTLNRVAEVSYTDGTPTVKYTYSEARTDAAGTSYFNQGQLTTLKTLATPANPSTGRAAVPETRQEYDYNRVGQVAAQRQVIGSDSYSLSYQYNLGGQLTQQTYPSGRTVKHSYDEAARLLTVGNAEGTQQYLSGLSYGAHGGVESATLGNGTVQAIGYNPRLQVSTLTLTQSSTNPEVLQRYQYKYGVVDQATGTVDEAKNTGQVASIEGYIGGTASAPVKQWQQRFSYDTIGRLSQASEYRGDNSQRTWQAVYDCDRYGNRYQKQSRQVQPLPYIAVEEADINQATNRFTSGVTYNAAGQITVDNKFRGMQYQYDANGRQWWSARTDNTGAATAVYDGLGQRVQLTENGATRTLVYDIFGKLVAEYGGQASSGTGGMKYVMGDHQGSTRVVMNASGGVINRHDYEPFGAEIGAGTGQRTTSQQYSHTDSTRQRYAGMERDEASGLDHTLWRKYESYAGRWTSADPYSGSMSITDSQSFNRYAYVQNDPINFVDPKGLNMCPAEFSSCGGGWENGGFGIYNSYYDGPWGAPMPESARRAEERYNSIRTTGYDPEFRRYWGEVALQILDPQGNVLYQSAWMHRPTLDMVWREASNMAEGMARNRVRNELRALGLEGHINLTPNGAGFTFRVNPTSADVVSRLLTNSSAFNSSSNPFYYYFHYNDAQCASGGCVDYRSLPGFISRGSMQFVYNESRLIGTVDIDRFNPRAGAQGFLGHAFLEVIPNALSDIPNIPGVSFRGFPTRP